MKFRYLIATAALLFLASCAKESSIGTNDDAKRYFDAWISQNHPAATRTPLGSYIISRTEGTGVPAGDSMYVRLNYSYYTLDGDLASTTDEMVARQCKTYSAANYYGPALSYRGENLEAMGAGLEEAISGMKVGGKMRIVIPGWLSQAARYDSEAEYLANCSGTDYIYDIELVDLFNDEEKWERDSLLRFMAANYPEAKEDGTYDGFFYVKEKGDDDASVFPSDTTFYINYTGRLLNGQVFDTTIADTAKVWNLYSSSTTYQQKSVTWYSDDEDFTHIKLADNEIINGFAYALSQMHPGEKGTCFFVSKYGYSFSGSGKSIPACSPLSFTIETTVAP